MRRTSLQAVILLTLPALLLGMPLLLAPHRIHPSAFRLIQPGMTLAEVVELLQAPPGNYDGYAHGWINNMGWNGHLLTLPEGSKLWCSRHGCVLVWFDEQGHVTDASDGESQPVTWLGRLYERFSDPQQVSRAYIY